MLLLVWKERCEPGEVFRTNFIHWFGPHPYKLYNSYRMSNFLIPGVDGGSATHRFETCLHSSRGMFAGVGKVGSENLPKAMHSASSCIQTSLDLDRIGCESLQCLQEVPLNYEPCPGESVDDFREVKGINMRIQ